MPIEMPGGGRHGGGLVEWHQPLCSEEGEHMALTGGIWPRFLHRDGCQTKATCVTGFRGAQSTPGRSADAVRAAPHQPGGLLVMRVHTVNMAA